jgi:sugar lactone lactonase YvrE
MFVVIAMAAITTGAACAQLIGADFDVHEGACSDPGCVEELATGLVFPWDVAVRDGWVYVTEKGHDDASDGRVVRMPAAGGLVEILAQGQERPNRIFLSSTHAYWTTTSLDGGVYRTALDGDGGVEMVADQQHLPLGVVADDGNVYWTANGRVMAQPIGAPGTSAAVTPLMNTPSFLALDGDGLYVTDEASTDAGGIYRVDLDGGPPTQLGEATPNANALTLCNSVLYFTTLADPGGVYSVTTDGNGLESLTLGQKRPTEVACDGARVYWATLADGSLWWTPAGGGAVQLLVDGQLAPNGVAVDADYVYWTNHDEPGNVRRTPKPH